MVVDLLWLDQLDGHWHVESSLVRLDVRWYASTSMFAAVGGPLVRLARSGIRQRYRYVGRRGQRVVHGAVCGDSQQRITTLGGDAVGDEEAHGDAGDAGRPASHVERGLDGQALGGQVVPGQEAARVEGDAGREARDEQLSWCGGCVIATVFDRLVDGDGVAADADVERVPAPGST